MLAADITWPLVAGLAVILIAVLFLAVLWSKREWNSRKVRIGMFLEREYRGGDDQEDAEVIPGPPQVPPPADEAPTKGDKDAW